MSYKKTIMFPLLGIFFVGISIFLVKKNGQAESISSKFITDIEYNSLIHFYSSSEEISDFAAGVKNNKEIKKYNIDFYGIDISLTEILKKEPDDKDLVYNLIQEYFFTSERMGLKREKNYSYIDLRRQNLGGRNLQCYFFWNKKYKYHDEIPEGEDINTTCIYDIGDTLLMYEHTFQKNSNHKSMHPSKIVNHLILPIAKNFGYINNEHDFFYNIKNDNNSIFFSEQPNLIDIGNDIDSENNFDHCIQDIHHIHPKEQKVHNIKYKSKNYSRTYSDIMRPALVLEELYDYLFTVQYHDKSYTETIEINSEPIEFIYHTYWHCPNKQKPIINKEFVYKISRSITKKIEAGEVSYREVLDIFELGFEKYGTSNTKVLTYLVNIETEVKEEIHNNYANKIRILLDTIHNDNQ